MPVSEQNKLAVVTWIIQLSQTALEELLGQGEGHNKDNNKSSGREVCTNVRIGNQGLDEDFGVFATRKGGFGFEGILSRTAFEGFGTGLGLVSRRRYRYE